MTDKKAQLQKAIITNNMDLVRDFYEYIFSEKAPMTLTKTTESSVGEIKIYKDRIKEAIALLSQAVPPNYTTDDETPISELEDEPIKASSKRQAEAVSKSTDDMQFISSKEFELPEDSMPGYTEAVKKLSSRKKTTREPYKPRMVECDSCGRNFDYNKEYPAGQLESGANAKANCNKCRSK